MQLRILRGMFLASLSNSFWLREPSTRLQHNAGIRLPGICGRRAVPMRHCCHLHSQPAIMMTCALRSYLDPNNGDLLHTRLADGAPRPTPHHDSHEVDHAVSAGKLLQRFWREEL